MNAPVTFALIAPGTHPLQIFGTIPAVPAPKVTSYFQRSEQLLDATTSVPERLDATITIAASAWFPSLTAAKAYRKAQIEVLEGSGGKPPSTKNLKLVPFVTERIQPSSELATKSTCRVFQNI